jgi:phospholipid/cholesterol/gamma-HCH transport system substrate-binding protein
MENRAYALAAGLFTLLLGVAVVATALWFSGQAVENDEYMLVSHYPVSGLNPQAPVRYRGVTVGKVVNINFDQQDPRAILVKILVQTGTPITEGAYAQLGSQGVTGLSYVMLDDDGKKPTPLKSSDGQLPRIPVKPSFMDTLSASGQELIANFNGVAQHVNTLLADDNQKQLFATLHHVDQATARFSSLATSMEPTIKALPAVINDAGLALKRADALLANIDRRLDSFERAANGTEQLTANGVLLMDAVQTDTVPRLNVLIEDVQRSSRGLERLLQEVNDQPQSLIFGRSITPPGPGEPGFRAQGGTK